MKTRAMTATVILAVSLTMPAAFAGSGYYAGKYASASARSSYSEEHPRVQSLKRQVQLLEQHDHLVDRGGLFPAPAPFGTSMTVWK